MITEFQQVVEAILDEAVTFEQSVALILDRGIHGMLDDIIGALPPEILKESIQQLGARNPAEVYGYVAENLRHGALESERERLRRQIGFRFHPPAP
jgi:hypothetical protein